MSAGPQNSVRVAATHDANVIGQLLFDFNTEFEQPTPDPPSLSARIRELMHSGETAVILGGEPACGLAVLRLRLAIWDSGLECYLAELYVAPEQRGKGLGRALMERAIDEARKRGATTMDINVDEPDIVARNLYESLGFANRSGGPEGPLMFFYERNLPMSHTTQSV